MNLVQTFGIFYDKRTIEKALHRFLVFFEHIFFFIFFFFFCFDIINFEWAHQQIRSFVCSLIYVFFLFPFIYFISIPFCFFLYLFAIYRCRFSFLLKINWFLLLVSRHFPRVGTYIMLHAFVNSRKKIHVYFGYHCCAFIVHHLYNSFDLADFFPSGNISLDHQISLWFDHSENCIRFNDIFKANIKRFLFFVFSACQSWIFISLSRTNTHPHIYLTREQN